MNRAVRSSRAHGNFPLSTHTSNWRLRPRGTRRAVCDPHPLEHLEPRQLLSAVVPNNFEQYLIELINRARANPTQESALFGIDLNEGLPPGTISSAPKQPLAVNPYLTDAARGHSQWMLDTDTFGHTGANGSSPGGRQTAAGYVFVAPYQWGENIAWRGQFPAVPDPAATTRQLHQDLFVDAGIDDRGHRTNLLDPAYREIGTGVLSGVFTQNNTNYNAVMASEEFATSASTSGEFLTGVAYSDAVTHDSFYTPGEGLGGITITAKRLSDLSVFTATTYASGGYSLALAPGAYRVTASGAGLPQTVGYASVTIGSENIKRDFTPQTPSIDAGPPTASLNASNISSSGGTTQSFTVTYSDNASVDISTIDGSDIQVTGPGYSAAATLVSLDTNTNGTPRTATYRITARGGTWDSSDTGQYTISLQPNQVADTSGNFAAAATLGTFQVSIAAPPTISAAASDASASEAGPNTGAFTLTRTGSTSSGLTVQYTVSGSASSGVDYQSLSGQATFSAGSPTATVTVTPIDDAQHESDETVILSLSDNAAYIVDSPNRSATVTIHDNDPIGLVNARTLITASDAGSPPVIRGFVNGAETFSFDAYSTGYLGGVRLALGDVTGDGVRDIITAPGPGGPPHVRVIDGATGQALPAPLGNFFAYASTYLGGVFVASADINGDGKADIITGTEAGPPHVKVFSGADGSLLASFYAYDPGFLGGVRVAGADINGDSRGDIITAAGPGAGPHVKVFSGIDRSLLASFWAYDPGFHGGVFVAAGDINGDGQADILTGAASTAPHVKAFRGSNQQVLASFFAYAPGFAGGVRVAAEDINGDGAAEILTTPGPGLSPSVLAWKPANPTPVSTFFSGQDADLSGLFVA